jgi:hypothetical protein
MIISPAVVGVTEFSLPLSKAPFALSGHRWPEFGFLAKERKHFLHQRVSRDAVLLPKDWDGTVFDELIGPTDAHHRCINHLRVQMFHHRAAETVV